MLETDTQLIYILSLQKRNSYSSKEVSFNMTMEGYKPVKITAKENQPLGDVFKEYSEKVVCSLDSLQRKFAHSVSILILNLYHCCLQNMCSGNLRFLWESRLSDTTLVGEIKEVRRVLQQHLMQLVVVTVS